MAMAQLQPYGQPGSGPAVARAIGGQSQIFHTPTTTTTNIITSTSTNTLTSSWSRPSTVTYCCPYSLPSSSHWGPGEATAARNEVITVPETGVTLTFDPCPSPRCNVINYSRHLPSGVPVLLPLIGWWHAELSSKQDPAAACQLSCYKLRPGPTAKQGNTVVALSISWSSLPLADLSLQGGKQALSA
ncbi:hypothetical protein JOB18_046209 [Solea senegalensis]|uniref:Uncharacterized protein n=1 Tax=Solea senegalensis TaxID=28829 RepID=A0AAV6Q8I2_SOLSE|nr:hypothetical protein JOB18_046209 [Solea senegalensis]